MPERSRCPALTCLSPPLPPPRGGFSTCPRRLALHPPGASRHGRAPPPPRASRAALPRFLHMSVPAAPPPSRRLSPWPNAACPPARRLSPCPSAAPPCARASRVAPASGPPWLLHFSAPVAPPPSRPLDLLSLLLLDLGDHGHGQAATTVLVARGACLCSISGLPDPERGALRPERTRSGRRRRSDRRHEGSTGLAGLTVTGRETTASHLGSGPPYSILKNGLTGAGPQDQMDGREKELI
jgi:hypothetical protein